MGDVDGWLCGVAGKGLQEVRKGQLSRQVGVMFPRQSQRGKSSPRWRASVGGTCV